MVAEKTPGSSRCTAWTSNLLWSDWWPPRLSVDHPLTDGGMFRYPQPNIEKNSESPAEGEGSRIIGTRGVRDVGGKPTETASLAHGNSQKQQPGILNGTDLSPLRICDSCVVASIGGISGNGIRVVPGTLTLGNLFLMLDNLAQAEYSWEVPAMLCWCAWEVCPFLSEFGGSGGCTVGNSGDMDVGRGSGRRAGRGGCSRDVK